MTEPVTTPRCAILTVSDRGAAGLAEDRSGPALADALRAWEPTIEVVRAVVPDARAPIQAQIRAWADDARIPLILTTGGTGFAPTDLTPEAVAPLIERPTPGLVVAMIHAGLATTPYAMLSRPVAGIRGQSLIVTLPGSPKGAVESLMALLPALGHGIRLMLASPGESERHGTSGI